MNELQMQRADRGTRVSIVLLTAIMVGWIGLTFLTKYESTVMPVVRDFKMTTIEQETDSVIVSGSLRKVRACGFVDLVAYVGDYYDEDAERERLYLRFIDQPGDTSRTREPGTQGWGPWQIMRPARVTGPHFWVRVRHDCHPLAVTAGSYLKMDAAAVFGQR